MKRKNKNFVKRNRCPYCTYPCDSAFMQDDKYDKEKPTVGDISFCMMCCEPSQWDANMKLVKFDLNKIPDLIERNRIKVLGMRVQEFWDKNPDKTGRRNRYLKILDKTCGG